MFDFGFSEIALITVVSLIVLGPERLPRVARTAGHLFTRLQRYVSNVKADISREIELDEFKRMQREITDSAQKIEDSVRGGIHAAEQDLKGAIPGRAELDDIAREQPNDDEWLFEEGEDGDFNVPDDEILQQAETVNKPDAERKDNAPVNAIGDSDKSTPTPPAPARSESQPLKPTPSQDQQ